MNRWESDKARAVCEATVRRVRDYVDSTDDAAILSSSTGAVPTLKAANTIFVIYH